MPVRLCLCVCVQAAGTKGQRYSMKNTRIMMTQPMGGSQGDIYAIAATVKELNAIYQVGEGLKAGFQSRVSKQG